MIYKTEKKNHIIETNSYKAILSECYGGTLKKFIYKGIDTKLRREGTEYWSNKIRKNHWEQEYSKNAKIKVKNRNKECIELEVESDLVSPQLKTIGGSCKVIYYFYETLIKGKSIIFPKFGVGQYDRYVCFAPNFYTHYNFIEKSYNDKKQIKKIICKNNVIGITIINKNIGLSFYPDKKLRGTGLYPSRSMLELKSHTYDKKYETKTESIIIPFKL